LPEHHLLFNMNLSHWRYISDIHN